jgi:hypothetical protein
MDGGNENSVAIIFVNGGISVAETLVLVQKFLWE